MATIVVRGRWRSQASGLARKRGVMASKITPQQPRATFPGLTEGSGYEREAAVPGCLGTGVPTTLKLLKAYPAAKVDLKPHERSRSAKELAWTFVFEWVGGAQALDGE